MTDSITGSRAHSPVRTLGRRWFNLSLAVALAASVAGCGGGSGGDPAAFKAAWAAAPQSALEVIPTLPAPVAASFGNQTVRQIVRASIAGDQARVRFSNLFGTVPLTIGAARVARSVGGSAIDTTSDRELRFAGAATLTLAAGAEAWSDPVDLTVGAQTDLAISTYLPGTVPIVTQHSLGRQENFVVPGNQVSTATVATSDTRQSYFNLTGVDVRATGKTNVVVTFGDSITDGFAATVNQNHRWPDYFARRLQANPGAGTVSVVNVGISGNRILNDVIGPRALDRFDRDVNQTGATHVTILIGINDIGFSSFIPAQAPTVGQITAGLQTLIDKARARGLKVFVATLTPFKGAGYYTEAGETKRAAYNAFVRANATIDGLIDFDAATRNPADPLTLLPAYDSGDHLHPNDAGYEAMANAIALGPFQVR